MVNTGLSTRNELKPLELRRFIFVEKDDLTAAAAYIAVVLIVLI